MDSQGSKIVPFAAIILILSSVSSLFFGQPDLTPKAPKSHRFDGDGEEKSGRVYARMWQDPLEVFKETKDGGSDSKPIDSLKNPIIVILPGGNSIEDHEKRIRIRTALISSFHALNFFAQKPDYLSYFVSNGKKFPYEVFYQIEAKKVYSICYISQNWLDDKAPLQSLVKFFQKEKLLEGDILNVIGPASSGTALAIAKNARQLGCLRNTSIDLNPIQYNTPYGLPIRLECSFFIEAIPGTILRKQVLFHSPWATAAPFFLQEFLCKPIQDKLTPQTSLGDYMNNEFSQTIYAKKLKFFDYNCSDLKLAAALMSELYLRGFNYQTDGVIVVGEWDSVYSLSLKRALVNTLLTTRELVERRVRPTWEEIYKSCRQRDAEEKKQSNVMFYGYLSGLEGSIRKVNEHVNSKESKENGDASTTNTPYKAIGETQLDYVARLCRKVDKDCSETNFNPKAIILVGSNIYDKLQLLQALRNRFPSQLFLTTDLDARYLEKAENQWTRNLIIATNYGLCSQSGIFKNLPPFRDSYQMAAANALVGIVENKRELPSSPLVYEVGRTRFHDLKQEVPSSSRLFNHIISFIILIIGLYVLYRIFRVAHCAMWLYGKFEKHVAHSIFRYFRLVLASLVFASIFLLFNRSLIMIFIFAIILIFSYILVVWIDRPLPLDAVPPPKPINIYGILYALLVKVFPWLDRITQYFKRLKEKFCPEPSLYFEPTKTNYYSAFSLSIIITLAIYVIYVVFSKGEKNAKYLTLGFDYEPFAWFDGVSIYPVVVSQGLIFFIGLWLLFFYSRKEHQHLLDINTQFFEQSKLIIASAAVDNKLKQYWTNEHSERRKDSVFFLALTGTILYVLLSVLVRRNLFCPELPPIRGIPDLTCTQKLIAMRFPSVIVVFLLFWITAHIWYCVRFIRTIEEKIVKELVKKLFSNPLRTSVDFVSIINLIGKRTEIVGLMMFYPFMLLVVSLFTYSSWLDRCEWGASLTILTCCYTLFAIYNVVILRRKAEHTKEYCVIYMKRLLTSQFEKINAGQTNTRAHSGVFSVEEGTFVVQEIRNALENIEKCSYGIFAPLHKNPYYTAIIFPFTGGGIIYLLNFFNMA